MVGKRTRRLYGDKPDPPSELLYISHFDKTLMADHQTGPLADRVIASHTIIVYLAADVRCMGTILRAVIPPCRHGGTGWDSAHLADRAARQGRVVFGGCRGVRKGRRAGRDGRCEPA